VGELDSNDALLDLRLRVAEDTVITQETRFEDGGWQPESPTLRLESGLPFSAELDAPTARMVRELDGSRTLREVLAVGDETAKEAGVIVARRMLEIGFLELGV
jgi:hypothetical protein